ncbi:MAG TPA: hypothetical protein VGL97_16955 [Bryobacteraceae bacterium]|jgi:hypothetical protein
MEKTNWTWRYKFTVTVDQRACFQTFLKKLKREVIGKRGTVEFVLVGPARLTSAEKAAAKAELVAREGEGFLSLINPPPKHKWKAYR